MLALVFNLRSAIPRTYCNYNKYYGLKKHCQCYGSQANRSRYEMGKAYLRNAKDSEELHISFRYINENLQIDRDFNFCRRMNEKIDDALVRIRSNIEKEFQKKAKRNKKKKTTPAQVPEPLPVEIPSLINIDFLRGECKESITDITFTELLQDINNGLKLRVLDKQFDIVLNQPWAQTVQLPSSILAGFLVYPSKLELQFAERAYCQGAWYRAKLTPTGDLQRDAKWELCGEGLSLTTRNEDIGQHLKVVITPGNQCGDLGPTVEHIAKCPVQAGPGPCPFEERHNYTRKALSGSGELRIVSYNLLADYYADSDYSRKVLFPYCQTYALAIDYRKQLFLKELSGYNADVLCLQEVDLKVFDLDLKTVLGAPEYQLCGHIAQKGTCAEGVATFYRSTRLQLVSHHVLNLGENLDKLKIFETLWQKIKQNEALVTRICDRSTTLQVTVLKFHDSNQHLIVANTHLYFHPDADHIRLLQIGFSMLYVEHIYKETLATQNIGDERDLAVIFCGDFNSVPECGIYKLMTERHVPSDFIDWRSNAEEAVKNVVLKQPFNMSSACGTPMYTNFTELFAACLDYIFYQNDRLEVVQSVPLPSEQELRAHTAIPSVCFPSDHVSLIADLKFKQKC